MSYVSKKEKVFDLPDQDDSSSTSLVKGSDHNIKILTPNCEKGCRTLEECLKHQTFQGFINAKEVNAARDAGFKYIPMDDLLTILMAEKDAYIRELLEKIDKCTCRDQLLNSSKFEDSGGDREALIRKDAEVVALKNKNAALESELDECRETLTKAMHKLETIEDILNENVYLSDKLKIAEEMVKLLEDNKRSLEAELENHKKCLDHSYQVSMRNSDEVSIIKASGDSNLLQELYAERTVLKEEIEVLQKELFQAKVSMQEMDLLKTQSETILVNLQEISKENEGYRRKLEGMKKLEKCVDDLRKQAVFLSEKYKRECQRVKEQMRQININAKELLILRQERDELSGRVAKLSSYESEYYSIKKKLNQVNQIIDENEVLNSKLSQLNTLEQENGELRKEIDRLKLLEVELNEKNEKIRDMEGDLKSQEEEIRDLTGQIKHISKEYIDEKEYLRLQNEILSQIEIIKTKEEQLKEIPILQTEIDELKTKLQKYMDDSVLFQKSEKRLRNELEAYRQRHRDLEEMIALHESAEQNCTATSYQDKLSVEEVSVQKIESAGSCHLTELAYQPDANLNSTDKQNLTEILDRTNKFKELLSQKDTRITLLESEVNELKVKMENCSNCEKFQSQVTLLETDVITLKESNSKLQTELSAKFDDELRIERLENSLKCQKKAVHFYKTELKHIEEQLLSTVVNQKQMYALTKLQKEESLLSKKEVCVNYLTEIENLKSEIDILKRLISELKEENRMLRKIKLFTEFTGKKTFENILKKLKAEVMVLQNLSKPQLASECQMLQAEVKRLVEEADSLKQALDAERKLKDYLEKELNVIQRELSFATKARNKNGKVRNVYTMTEAFIDRSEEIKQTLNDIKLLKEENEEFVKEISRLQTQCQSFEGEVMTLQTSMHNLQRTLDVERDVTYKQKEEIDALNEKIRGYTNEITELRNVNENFQQNSIALREELTAKESEVNKTKKELIDMANELSKLNSELEEMRIKLESKQSKSTEDINDDESIIFKVAKEFEELRKKLEDCKTEEEKINVLRTKRNNLLVKVNYFETEVEFLKKKLVECDVIKNELEQLKAERITSININEQSEEKLLSDIFSLKEQIKMQQKEIEHAKKENFNIKEKLSETNKLLEMCRKNHKQKDDVNNTAFHANKETISDAKLVEESTSCEKIGDTISVEEFQIEIGKIETKHKNKVQKLKEGNAKKIKSLIAQYEKENKNRNKAYNDSINTIKSNYESDIKKLIERHKSSIIRLQNLHEDEVQELNTNYETQMEAMQTLNENVVNDLTSGAAEKNKLTEMYNKEIKDVEMKFQKLLKEKENQHMIEVASLQENLTRNISELKEAHKKDIDNINRMYKENLVQTEEKHNREMKKCKRNNIKRIDMMRHKYEDLLTEERKKFEEQLQIMLNRLKIGHQGDQIPETVDLVYLQKSSLLNQDQNLELNKILQKVLFGGFQSLQFDELMLLHCKTCFAAESYFEELNMQVEHEGDLLGNACPHMPLLKEEKEELLKRIFILENAIAIKQLETHEAIISMETAEKCRIEELNTLLMSEREKNEELKMMLNNQTMAQTDLKIESYMLDRQASLRETNLIEKVKEIEVLRSEKRALEEELQKEKSNIKRLTLTLDNEMQRFKSQRKKDSEYIEAMRMRLEEALSHEQIMESQLDYEAQFRSKLECELQSLQRSFNLIIDQPPPPTTVQLETKTVKDKQNLDQFESEKEDKLSKSKIRSKMKPPKNI